MSIRFNEIKFYKNNGYLVKKNLIPIIKINKINLFFLLNLPLFYLKLDPSY